jgi:hypothetical protein
MERDDEKVTEDITAVPIGFDGKWKTLDWCPVCIQEAIAPLRELWDKAGIDIEPPKRPYRKKTDIAATAPNGEARRGRQSDSPRDKQCLWCPADYAAETGLLRHWELQHGLPHGIREALGSTCPVCGEDFGSLGGHAVRTHGVSHISQAFVLAREQGDPHGVVKRVLAKGSAAA